MKFFKKRLSKNKQQVKSSSIIAATPAGVTDTNKPLPPSPSSELLQSSTLLQSTRTDEINHDSLLQFSEPNHSNKLDMPLLNNHEEQRLPSDKLEIPPHQIHTSDQQVENNITECCYSSPSYPDNHIDTTVSNDETKAFIADTTASSESLTLVSLQDQQESLPTLLDATLSQTNEDVQQAGLVDEPTGSLSSATAKVDKPEKENEKQEQDFVEKMETRTPNLPAVEDKPITTPAAVLIGGGEEEQTDQSALELLKEQEELPTTITSLLENCAIDVDHPLLIAETPSTTTPISPNLAADTAQEADQSQQADQPQTVVEEQSEPSSQQQQLLQLNDETSRTSHHTDKKEDVAAAAASLAPPLSSLKETSKMAKRKSVVSLIPRKQPHLALAEEPLQKPSLSSTTTLKSDRRGSSSSFIPVPTRLHTNCSTTTTTNKDVVAAAPVAWSASSSSSDLSLERDTISSTSSSGSSCSQQDDYNKASEKRASSGIAKPHTIQQQLQQLPQQQHSKIPKATFGIPLATNHDIPKVTTTTTQYTSRLPTKRSSNVV
ncbi:hypothetical protein [Parasitella parasitica]|uniref:Uncharacterized protein n=1 Tax=Parasitella parasitica TaxID=35722 RepID=A0A0B7NA90_9FUNG|nr:hypothetical protein [Parasitella parasitica]